MTLRSGAYLVASSVFYQLCTWLVIVLIARRYGAVDVGTYAFAMSVTTPIYLFLNLQLRNLLAVARLDTVATATLWRVRVGCMLLGLVLSYAVGSMISDSSSLSTVMVLALTRSAEGLSDLSHGFIQRYADTAAIALSMGLRGLAATMAALVAAVSNGTLLTVCVAMAVATFIVFLLFDLPRSNHAVARRPAGLSVELRHVVAAGLTLGTVTLLANASTSVPRIFLYRTHGSASLGGFSLLYYVVVAAGLLADVLGQSFQTLLLQAKSHDVLKRAVLLANLLGLGAGVVVLVFGPGLVMSILGFVYAGAASSDPLTVRAVLAAAVIIALSRLMRYPLTASGLHVEQFWVALAGLLASLGITLTLMERLGPLAAAFALLIQGSIEFVFHLLLLSRHYQTAGLNRGTVSE